jgi:transcriptional regulator with XRE-family HTH domain
MREHDGVTRAATAIHTQPRRMAMVVRKKATMVDVFVGARIREYRVALGLTQNQLGAMIGSTNQQVHKYEKGIDRLSAGQLYEIAQALDMPVTYFYEGFGEDMSHPFALGRMREIAHNFKEFQNETHQEAFSQVVRTLAGR